MLCFVTYVSRSVISAIVIHSVYNITALTLSDYVNGIAAHLESFSLLFIVMLFLLWLLIIVSLTESARVYRTYAEKGLDSTYTVGKLSRAQRMKAGASVYFSVPFLISVIIYIAVVVFSMQNIT